MDSQIRPCRVCGIPIQFVPTGEVKNGKPVIIPLDQRAPVYDVVDGKARQIHGFVTHWATCPAAHKIKEQQKAKAEQEGSLLP
jgi:hypothetical protein